PNASRAQEALERLIDDPGQRQRVAGILEPLYEAQGAWGQLARVLEVQLEDAGDPGSQVELLMRIGQIHDQRLHTPDAAFEAFARVVVLDPADPGCRQELGRLAAMRGSQRERAEVLEKAIAGAEDSAYLRSELLLELARLWDDIEQDMDRAEAAYLRLIEADADNPDVVLPASQALERIHLSKEDYPALAADLRRQVRLESEPVIQSGLLVRLADLLELTLEDKPGAIAAHRERMEIDPGDLEAMRSLERIHEELGEWEELISVLQARDGAEDDPAQQLQIGKQIALVFEQRLEDVENAIVAHNEVLNRFGQDPETLTSLARLYRRSEKWDDLHEVIEMQLGETTDPISRAELLFEAAELLRLHLGESERSVESHAEVLASVPGHEGSIAALRALMSGGEGEQRIMAARVLVPHFEMVQDFSALIDTLRVVAESDEPSDRILSLRRAAEVADLGLSNASQAFDLQGQAVRAGLEEEGLAELIQEARRFAAESGRWADFVQLLEDAAGEIMDADLQTEALMDIAAVSRERLADSARATALYTRVLENQPEHRGALDALDELHAASGDDSALLSIVRRKSEVTEDGSERVDLLLRQAQICERLGDLDGGVDALEGVLAEDGLMDEPRRVAFEGLVRLHRRGERFEDVGSALERQLEAGVGDPVEVRFQLGQVQHHQLGDAYAALDSYRETLSQSGGHEGCVAALEQLMEDPEHRGAAAEILEPVFLSRMDWPRVTGALEARIASEDDVEERKALLRRLGEIHEDYLEDLEGAMATYARLFREDPADRDIWETL
ncbi:MAG: hypothetical protein OEY14_16495, partial [Myxococcales bacterium]|nr:hypothetical protein [Myxococcales bacterium]